ncbi:hypothetical protein PHYBLDRAFT_73125 [Phycomyces blakesleeanus NRRL 1555(-)]|uniref:Uncharacterized protein n=1 Tax=Phycomyces blakesleeanus (strain ATCC 8743b / DSM 1359 / FGSC 10004 / NBRC 33097 / NRRL 1555) TaxID=763407 RepID=A0A167JJI9_PHYB8|nr:hypothetical protein PHYBLDRAFT_73125 [Phycomyces blakesleeanus NRRL 1555(-)]OAD66117.1 hypothetical protein PHYBLDRAFT_73125 [Phycomyces blakesleeanus NRRL 1555(-)]|eukprot:XP_018284157.1 hypothetical protein PHYBLDRAFT_73125 [Phycomyces blakesleeanus NRRL 1555(-)]
MYIFNLSNCQPPVVLNSRIFYGNLCPDFSKSGNYLMINVKIYIIGLEMSLLSYCLELLMSKLKLKENKLHASLSKTAPLYLHHSKVVLNFAVFTMVNHLAQLKQCSVTDVLSLPKSS